MHRELGRARRIRRVGAQRVHGEHAHAPRHELAGGRGIQCRMAQRTLGAEVPPPPRVDHDDGRHALGKLAELVDPDHRAVVEPLDVEHERLADELVERDRVECPSPRDRVGGRVDVRAGVRTHADRRHRRAVAVELQCGREVHPGVSGVHHHVARDGVAQLAHALDPQAPGVVSSVTRER